VTDNEQFWRAIVTGDAGVMRLERRRHRRIPGAPRCKTCLVPLGGPAAPVVRLFLKRRPSTKNPNYCDVCETFVRTHPGGAEVVALYVPAVGADHARKAVEAAGDLLRATADLVPVVAGVHTGVAYVGAVGSDSTVADFTALGEAVNVTARLASLAGAGQALISEAAHTASGSDLGDLEPRELTLKVGARSSRCGSFEPRRSRAAAAAVLSQPQTSSLMS
jgi:adenylate cyclase